MPTLSERPKIRYKKPWDRETQDRKKHAERRARRRPFIYFLRCGKFIKIGWTTDIEHRLSCVQSCNPDIVTVAALLRGGPNEEAILHRTFRAIYHRAEWFREEGSLAELINLIAQMAPTEAREAAGDWYLKISGKTDMLLPASAAQKADHGQRIIDESIAETIG